MANLIKIKRSAVPGKIPQLADLQLGELAINTNDGKLYFKKNDGVESIVEIGPGMVGSTGFTGSFGYTGSQGALGYTGSQGVTGFSGSQGDTGFSGSQGDIGYSGSQGVIGFSGSIGVTGFTGSHPLDTQVARVLQDLWGRKVT
jgi:hypothetical protein